MHTTVLALMPLFSLPDETIVHPDVSSYLSSQGTLSERQDMCIRVETGGGPQPNGHVVDTTGTAKVRSLLPNVCVLAGSFSHVPWWVA